MAVLEFEHPSSIDAALDALEAQLDFAAPCFDFELDAGLLAQRAVWATRIAERAKALAADRVGDAARAGVPRRSGVRTMGILLGQGLQAPSKAMAPYATLGEWMGRFARFSSAWKAGTLTEAHMRLLRSLDNPRTHRCLVDAQDEFLGWATDLEWEQFVKACLYWLLAADPDGELPTEFKAAYGIKVRRLANGDVKVEMLLDPVSGEAFLNATEHEDQKLFREMADDPDVEWQVKRRNSRRRKLAALMQLISRGFARADGSHPIPLINIVMSEGVAERLLRELVDPEVGRADFDLAWDDVDRRCETIRGVPLHPRRVGADLLIAEFRRQISRRRTRLLLQERTVLRRTPTAGTTRCCPRELCGARMFEPLDLAHLRPQDTVVHHPSNERRRRPAPLRSRQQAQVRPNGPLSRRQSWVAR